MFFVCLNINITEVAFFFIYIWKTPWNIIIMNTAQFCMNYKYVHYYEIAFWYFLVKIDLYDQYNVYYVLFNIRNTYGSVNVVNKCSIDRNTCTRTSKHRRLIFTYVRTTVCTRHGWWTCVVLCTFAGARSIHRRV